MVTKQIGIVGWCEEASEGSPVVHPSADPALIEEYISF